MKTARFAAALALVLAPAIGTACEYMDSTSASLSPPTQLGAASPPSSKTPERAVEKLTAPESVKPVAAKPQGTGKVKSPAGDQKLAATTPN